MITLQLFARYRELLDTDHEQLEYDPQLATVGELRDRLVARGEGWEVLAEPCALSEPLTDGDEIAFFPPVTGG